MSEEIKKEVKEQEVKQETKQEEVKTPAEVVKDVKVEEPKVEPQKEEVKAEEPVKDEAKTETKKDSTKKSTGKKAADKKEKSDKKETQKKKEEKQEEKELPPISYKPLASSSKNTAIHSLMLRVKNGKLDMNHSVQRKAEQWKLDQKEKFLHSLIIGVISPEIVVAEMENSSFVVDGKQRLSCLNEYINKKDTKLTVFGRKFDELDEATKDALTGSNINVVTYANVTDEDIFALFERYNNGVSLSSAQKSRSYCTIELLNKINVLLNSVFIKDRCNITKGQSLKDEDLICIIQAAMIASGFDFKSFNGKEVDRYLQETDSDSIMATLEVIEEHIQILDSIVSEKNKNLKKIHLPMILACADNSEAFANKLQHFLENYDNVEEQEIQSYKQNFCLGSTSQKAQVEGRLAYWKNL